MGGCLSRDGGRPRSKGGAGGKGGGDDGGKDDGSGNETSSRAPLGHAVAHTTSFGGNNDDNGSRKGSVGEVTTLRTAAAADLYPPSFEATLAVWGIDDFSDTKNRRDPPRFALSSPSDRIDVFVSHVWHDVAFLDALRLQDKDRQTRSCHGSTLQTEEHRGGLTPETVFYHLKAPGLMKGVRQLAARGLAAPDLPADHGEWRVWMDLVCIDQFDERHKAHVTRMLDRFVDASRTMVVLLSTSYFTRLWCVYECCCFLAKHEVVHMAVYSWAFADRITLSEERRAGAPPELEALATLAVASLRGFTVAGAKCSFECDRAVLMESVREHYVSVPAFERFAKFAGILAVVWGLVMSPAVYNETRYATFASPWIALAKEIGFDKLHDALAGFDAVALYKTKATSSNPELCPAYTAAAREHFDARLRPLTDAERARAVRAAAADADATAAGGVSGDGSSATSPASAPGADEAGGGAGGDAADGQADCAA